jgi:hypothetical protein
MVKTQMYRFVLPILASAIAAKGDEDLCVSETKTFTTRIDLFAAELGKPGSPTPVLGGSSTRWCSNTF